METLIILIAISVLLIETTYLVLTARKDIPRRESKPIFVDTSVLIDGRIIAVANSGFITGTLNIPRSVIAELQLLADGADSEKRTRARHGLDVISELQGIPKVNVKIFPDDRQARRGVDHRLLELAKKHHGMICTIDYNLNKVAQVDDIPVLNVNELAMGLRMAYLPGEKMLLDLTQKGQENHQAVGHLSDGTMVVVEKASNHVGQTVEIEFTRALQTSAGKMMFARLVKDDRRNAQKRPYNTRRKTSSK